MFALKFCTEGDLCVFGSLQMHMFIARYCDLLNVEISCDGCERIAPGHRYRCLQCTDMDLCKTCFLSEQLNSFNFSGEKKKKKSSSRATFGFISLTQKGVALKKKKNR